MVPDIINYWKIDPQKISVIYNTIGRSWLIQIPPQEGLESLNKYKINKKFLLFVGTIQPRKNLSRTLEAYQLLPKHIREEYTLVVVGKKGWDCDELIAKLHYLQKENIIKWLEFVNEKDLRALYQFSSMLLFPSLSEGFGLPIIEGFASKTPVITSNIPPMNEIAADAACLIDPLSVNEMKNSIEKIILDGNYRNNLITKGYDRVKNFLPEKTTNQLISIYKAFGTKF